MRATASNARIKWMGGIFRMDADKENSKERFHIGIDLGGTKIEGIVLDHQYRECRRIRMETRASDGYLPVLQRIIEMHSQLAAVVLGEEATLGICTPGSISKTTGLLKNCNATELNGHPLQADLRQRLGRPFAMENDANCFAIAEARQGAGSEHGCVLGLVLGTGVGAGIVVDGRVWSGRHGIAGEWGHMSIDPDGPACYCGRQGCVERYLSGTALEASYRQSTGQSADVARVVEMARHGDGAAVELLDRFLSQFAGAVANVVAVLDPDVIVIGGGLASMDELYEEGALRLQRMVFNDDFHTPVLRNRLGNSAGVIGAAMVGV
ncbi:ROK family protein [Acidovorax sp. SUPP1855]|uniref:ROK family protein n=1 Tax=Acidovorax sp. SUPP1855 TaxID=431774 RepID=UPI0024E0ACC7|nr:ROK family protein [Acidovorax sp. SUPP1855]